MRKGLASKFLRTRDLRLARRVVRSLSGWLTRECDEWEIPPPPERRLLRDDASVEGWAFAWFTASRFGNELVGLDWFDWELLVGSWDMVPLLPRQISQ